MTLSARAALVALVLTSLSACTTGATDSIPTDAADTSSQAQQREVDLRYVSPTASPCASVWTIGAVLPSGYEWCAGEDGSPVAGVRIGSCEVVVHHDEAYAVPGRVITPVVGPIASDRDFLAALTSCKRRPASTAPR